MAEKEKLTIKDELSTSPGGEVKIETPPLDETTTIENQISEEKNIKKPKVKKEKKEKINMVFECPFAPMGKSSTVIEGTTKEGEKKTYSLPLMNKRYTIPKKITESEKEKLRFCLKQNGFLDVTTVSKKGIVYVKNKNAYMYYAIHPAHTDRHPINGNISFVMKDKSGEDVYDNDGKQITKSVKIKNGIAETDDKDIYNLLLKHNFLPAGKEEIK